MTPRVKRWIGALAVAYFILMLVAVTYPGYVPFNRIRPFVIGLPFALFWQVVWISGSVVVLTLVYWSQRASREREERGERGERRGERGT